MSSLRLFLLSGMGIAAGVLIAVQSVLNASLGQRSGQFGSMLLLTFISAITLIILIVMFPSTANFSTLPGFSEWYLYIGGVLGVIIVAIPIYLVPKIGTTSTLVAIVLGQSIAALVIDHFGFFASPNIKINLARGVGVFLVALGAYLVGK